MEKREHLIEDKKSKFGAGPWCEEPDRIEWRAHGLPCLMFRNPKYGHWCGYVGVPPEHLLHAKTNARFQSVEVDYAEHCAGSICHVPEPGEPNHIFWFGFSCSHYEDLSPGLHITIAELPDELLETLTYRDEAYVKKMVSSLCEEIASATRR